MHDFGNLVYLDLQKTGSTFVSHFLNRTCKLPLVREIKHARIDGWRYNKRAFYFITIRHPVTQYSSLFRYGLDRRGGLYERLKKLGKGDLYRGDRDSFNRWLRFLLDFSNAALLGEDYERAPVAYNLGFLSFRYLMLSLARPLRTLSKNPESVDVLRFAKDNTIVSHVILNESLNDGLLKLATVIKPEYFDQNAVRKFFDGQARVNASTVNAKEIEGIDDDVRKLIREKERLLLEYYPSSTSFD